MQNIRLIEYSGRI